MITMLENIREEDIPERYKTDIQDFVFFYCDRDKSLAQSYVSQLRILGFTGCLYDDDSYLNWRHTFEYDRVHELSKRSVIKFFLVTSEIQHDGELSLHKCETLMTSVKTKENSLVPIFEIPKDNIPDTPQFYGLRTFSGLYSAALKDGSKFQWLFNLPDSKERKRRLEQERDNSLKEWIIEEKLRRQKQRLLEEKKEAKRQKDRQKRHDEELANVDKLAEDEIQREDLQRKEEEQYRKLLPRLRELAEETGKSPEELYTMTKKSRFWRDKDDHSLHVTMDKILETVNQLKEEQPAIKGEGTIEDQKGAAKSRDTHYHIVIEKADNSEIKIGPSYDTDRATSSVPQPAENNPLHKETRRQFTTDGAGGSEPFFVDTKFQQTDMEESSYLAYTEESSGQQDTEQETSSVEFDIPKDPTVPPVRVTDARSSPTPMLTDDRSTRNNVPPARITDVRSTPKNQQVQKSPEKKDVIIERSHMAQRAFNFGRFLLDEEESEDQKRVNEFSEDRVSKTTTDPQGISQKGTDDNKNTESMFTEVHSSEEPVTESYNILEAALAPPWAPKSSSLSNEMQTAAQSELGQVNNPLGDSLIFNTLDSTEIIIHTTEDPPWDIATSDLSTVGNPAPSLNVPEFPKLLSEESFSIQQSGKTDDYSDVKCHHGEDSEEPVALPQIAETPEVPHCSEGSGAKSIITNVTPQQSESTPTSLQDHARSGPVQVCVYESEEFQDDRHAAEEVVNNDISEGRDYSSENAGQPAFDHTPEKIREALDDHRSLAPAPRNTLRDSGIEMDQITEAPGVLVSGFQQLSATTVSMKPNIQDVQESRPDLSTTSYNVETGKRQGFDDEDTTSPSQCESWPENERASHLQTSCSSRASAMQTGCTPEAADEDTCGFSGHTPSSQEQPHDVAIKESRKVTSTHSSEDIKAAVPGTDDHPKDSTASVDVKHKQFDDLGGQREVSTGQECLQSLEQLSDDLEEIRLTGTWV